MAKLDSSPASGQCLGIVCLKGLSLLVSRAFKATQRKPDNPERYPSRNALTGGFAGGERGLQQFVEEGDIRFADPGVFVLLPFLDRHILSLLHSLDL